MSGEKPRLIVIGARENGHPAVVIDILRLVDKYSVEYIADENIEKPDMRFGLKAMPLKEVDWGVAKGYGFTVATGCGKTRNRLSKLLEGYGLTPENIIHPSAIISSMAKIGKGVFVGPGAIINAGAVLEDNVLINSGSIVEHNAVVRSGATLGPGVVLGGRVIIGIESIVGFGACIVEDVIIGSHCKVAGNTLVKEDLAEGTYLRHLSGKAR